MQHRSGKQRQYLLCLMICQVANLAEVGGGPLLVALMASRIAALSCAWFGWIGSPE